MCLVSIRIFFSCATYGWHWSCHNCTTLWYPSGASICLSWGYGNASGGKEIAVPWLEDSSRGGGIILNYPIKSILVQSKLQEEIFNEGHETFLPVLHKEAGFLVRIFLWWFNSWTSFVRIFMISLLLRTFTSVSLRWDFNFKFLISHRGQLRRGAAWWRWRLRGTCWRDLLRSLGSPPLPSGWTPRWQVPQNPGPLPAAARPDEKRKKEHVNNL